MIAQPCLSQRESSPIERISDFLITNSLDKRLYRLITLPNKLEILLVHDAETDKASAALDVRVGSYSDEKDMPGMAHAVEHLLFMGTRKYPEDNAYSQYLAAHSGHSNAYTNSLSTHYYFDVAAKKSDDASENEPYPLYGALDRFAQFFIEPLFLASTVDRELHAVDSEHKKNLQDDDWREHRLNSSLSNPNHPFGNFSTGNLEVLKTIPEARGVDVRKKFIEFYEKHYSANRMKLTVLGRESLDVLEEWVVDLFSGIKNKNLSKNCWEEPLFREEDLLIQCFVKPIKDFHRLVLHFPTFNTEDLYESCPENYLIHLFDYEGPGSLTSCLKDKGWINSIGAAASMVCPGSPDIFICAVNLTEVGQQNYKEIVKIIFQFISLIKETQPQRWIHDEQNDIGQMLFKFKEKTPSVPFTKYASKKLQTPLPRKWLISSNYILDKFDPDMINAYLNYLRPDNFRIMLISQKYDGEWNMKEKWYGTEYTCEKIPADFLSEIKRAYESTAKDRLAELKMPQKNQFIPKNLNVEKKLVKEVTLSPKIIRDDDYLRVWHKKDDQFWVPKGNVVITFRSLITDATPENHLKTSIYLFLVQDTLQEYLYDAGKAGLGLKIFNALAGIDVLVYGYNDKISVYLEKVLSTMKNLQVAQDRFEVVKERLMKNLKNRALVEPYQRVSHYTYVLNSQRGFLNEEMLLVLPYLTSTDIQQFFPQILTQMHIEMFVHGNFYKEDALKLSDLTERIMKPRPLNKCCWAIFRSILYPPGSNYLYRITSEDPKNINNCIAYQLFIGETTVPTLGSKTRLLNQMIEEPAFHQLRTTEQLGYVVFSDYVIGKNTIRFQMILQSEKTSSHLETRIEAFLASFAKTLEKMSDTEFEDHKRSLITFLSKKLETLKDEFERMRHHINTEHYDFELVQKAVVEVKHLTKTVMIDFYKHHIDPASRVRSKLVICIDSQTASETVSAIIDKKIDNDTESGLDRHMEKENDKAKDLSPSSSTKPYIITDIHRFKAGLPCTAGPVPVRPITEFMDLEPKL